MLTPQGQSHMLVNPVQALVVNYVATVSYAVMTFPKAFPGMIRRQLLQPFHQVGIIFYRSVPHAAPACP